MRLLYQFPQWFHRLTPSLHWRGDSERKCVYLTFDDGPIAEITPQILDILDEYGIEAPFFWVGENVFRHPEVAKEVVKRGHRIGNHTFNHISGWKNTLRLYTNNIQLTEEIITANLGHDWHSARIFRPPYGRMKISQILKIRKDFRIYLWDIVTHDYNPNYTPDQIVEIVKKLVRNGSIIVFHDSRKAAKNVLVALPLVIQYLQSAGYEFLMLDSNE